MSIKDKIHAAKLAFASGRLNADSNGFIHVAGVGDIKLSSDYIASVGRSPRPTAGGGARARWDQAVEAAMVQCRGNRQRAVALVAKSQPQLRQQLLSEANPGKPLPQQPVARQGAKPVGRATAKIDSENFKQQLATLMEGGLSRRDAAKQLSQSMGLSQPRQEAPDSYWDQRKERYYS